MSVHEHTSHYVINVFNIVFFDHMETVAYEYLNLYTSDLLILSLSNKLFLFYYYLYCNILCQKIIDCKIIDSTFYNNCNCTFIERYYIF